MLPTAKGTPCCFHTDVLMLPQLGGGQMMDLNASPCGSELPNMTLCEQAVCCDDKQHCCAEGTTCDTKSMKCISTSTKKELPMWAKFPARQRADWENLKGQPESTSWVELFVQLVIR